MDEKKSRLIYIPLSSSRRLSFVAHVEGNAGRNFQVTVHGGSCELSGSSGFSRNHHSGNEYNVMPKVRLGARAEL